MMAAIAACCAAPAAVAGGGFEPRCTSDSDYGWPRFRSAAELGASKWARYFAAVYGGLPTAYPICVYDLWSLDAGAYAGAGLAGSRPIVDSKAVKEGDLFVAAGGGGLGIYHGAWDPVPNGTWVEVSHSVLPTELTGAWVWTTRGSGIWYNVGRTVVFPTPRDPGQTHAAAIAWLREGCTAKVSSGWPQLESDIFGLCAREKGVDSIQFAPTTGVRPIGTFNLTNAFEMVLTNLDGAKQCGVSDPAHPVTWNGGGGLRSGWAAANNCSCVVSMRSDGLPRLAVHPGSG